MNKFCTLICLISSAVFVVCNTNKYEIKGDVINVNVMKDNIKDVYLNLQNGCYLLKEFDDSLITMRSYRDAWENINKSNCTPIGFKIDPIVNGSRHLLFIHNFHEGTNLIIDSTGTIISTEGIRDKMPKHLKIEICQGNFISVHQLETDGTPIVNGVYKFVGDDFEKYFISILYASFYTDSLSQKYSFIQQTFTFPNGLKYACEFGSDLIGDEGYFMGGLRLSPILKTDSSCTYDLYSKNLDYLLYSNCDSNYSLILRPIK